MATPPPDPATTPRSAFDPTRWAIALVVILVFGAVAYRVVASCEAGSFELLNQLKISLGGCQKPHDPDLNTTYVNRHMSPIQEKTNLQGSDYSPRSIHAATADECSAKCDQVEWCKAMTFVVDVGSPFGGGDCWLKTSVPPPTAHPYMASAIKR
jgi:hypothetical protein